MRFPTKSKTRRSLLMKRRSQRLKRRSDDLEIIAFRQNISQSDLKKFKNMKMIRHLIPRGRGGGLPKILDRDVPRRFSSLPLFKAKKAKTDTLFKAQTRKMTPYSRLSNLCCKSFCQYLNRYIKFKKKTFV